MENFIKLQRKIVPELIAIIEERYNILRHVQYAQPVGRRALAALVGMSERTVRTEVEMLKNVGLVSFSSLGMMITPEGLCVLKQLDNYVRMLHGLTQIEEELKQKLKLRKVVIIPGNSDTDETVARELGRAAANVLAEYLEDGMTVAVSGGSTLARVAENINFVRANAMIVPARGGLGEKVEIQANTIAAVMADRLGADYRQLYVPDGVSEETLSVILAEDAQVNSVVNIIKKANILVHGVGTVFQMAQRRGLDVKTYNQIIAGGAVGEALGQYCSLAGDIVYVTSSVGLVLNDLAGIGTVMAVAGGSDKAQAILSVASACREDVLVTDEAAALAIRELLKTVSLE